MTGIEKVTARSEGVSSEAVSSFEQFIATYGRNSERHGGKVINTDDLREFMKGRILVDAAIAMRVYRMAECFAEGNNPSKGEEAALEHFEKALQPNTGEKS